MQIGILGAGHVGLAVGRRLIGAGHRVKLSSARDPHALTPVAQGIGAEAASVTEAAATELVLLAVPWPAAPTRSTRYPTGRAESSSTLRTHSSPPIRFSSLISRAEAPASSSPSMHQVRG
jgi:3-hydroxyisobutyrate dehydrogenase-like beta-hydroxyacid dehydrogenase